jgi:diacylglycerol kinase family enzyme
MGNANVVARELNIPLKPEQAIQLCISGQSKAIDLGLINHQDGKQTPFLAMIELGIGADIVRAVDQLRNGALEKLYKYWGDIVYVIGGLLATIKHKEPEFGFSMDGSTEQIRSSHAIIANMKTYAKGWSFNPQARCDDGKLDISTRRQKGIANIALAFISAANKSYKPKLMSYHTSQSIQISAADRIAVQIDGDPIDLPGDATVSIEPGAFQILIPKPSDS